MANKITSRVLVAELPVSNDSLDHFAASRKCILERRMKTLERSLDGLAPSSREGLAGKTLKQELAMNQVDFEGWSRLATNANAPWAQTLKEMLESSAPGRHAEIVQFLATTATVDGEQPQTPKRFSKAEASALLDMLGSTDVDTRATVSDALQASTPTLLRHNHDNFAASGESLEPKDKGEIFFNLATLKFEPLEKSWSYDIRLRQFFEYQVEGVVDPVKELTQKLLACTTDLATQESLVDAHRLEQLVDALVELRSSLDPSVSHVLDAPFELCFSTTDGGDTPVGIDWDLPIAIQVAIFDTLENADLEQHILQLAQIAKTEKKAAAERTLAPLRDLLEQYNGKPEQHRRAHAALINIGLAGKSFAEAAADGGILPLSETLLTPEKLATKYADTEQLKVRFVLDHNFRCLIVSDELFQEATEKWHCPPNHELLSYNGLIAGSGYLVIDHGEISAIFDDIELCPGKLPENLPPARLVLEKQGFPISERAAAAAAVAVDWEVFERVINEHNLVFGELGDIEANLASASCEVRTTALVQFIRALSAQGMSVEDIAAQVEEKASELQITNAGQKVFRNGDLPQRLNEWVDIKLSDADVRLAVCKKVVKS